MKFMKKALSAYFVMTMLTLKICAVGESAANLATQAVVTDTTQPISVQQELSVFEIQEQLLTVAENEQVRAALVMALQEKIIAEFMEAREGAADFVPMQEEEEKHEVLVKISHEEDNYQAAVIMACVLATITLAPTLLMMYLDLSPERQLQNYKHQQELEYAQAKDNFQRCLWQADANAATGFLNCPVACEKFARQLAGLGGKSDVRDMVQQFDAENR